MNINNRYRILTQDLNRFMERIDERIETETNNSIEVYRKFIDNLRVKLKRTRDDYRLTIDIKQRLITVKKKKIIFSNHSLRFFVYRKSLSH
jgi:hypothetical protein